MSDLPPAPSGTARLLALGDLRISDAQGRPVASLEAQPKRAALLIYLACQPAGSFCPRDQLLVLFWPDFDNERARNSLRTSLYYVRRAMGPGVVNSRPDGALEAGPPALWCDVSAFEAAARAGRWAEASELYRGDFLQGAGQSVSVEFDQWVEATRRRLRRQCADALYRLAEERERADDLEGALEALGRARSLLPADEAVLRKVLILWGRAGQRVRAVQEFEAFAQTLQELYELEPSEETRKILEQVTGESRSPVAAQTEQSRPPAEAPAEAPVEAPAASLPPQPRTAAVAEEPARSAEPPRPRRSLWWAPVGTATLVLALYWLGQVGAQGGEGAPGSAVAVLPFEVADGSDLVPMAEALPALLSDELRAAGWSVLDPQSLKDEETRWDRRLRRARDLGAGIVVTGQVIALGDSVAILVATVPTSGPPAPRHWARATGVPAQLGVMVAALGQELRAGAQGGR